MPNTPALVLAGMSALYAGPPSGAAERAAAEEHSRGGWHRRSGCEREEQMDAVTAVSGSGPAYVFYFMEALAASGTRAGLGAERCAPPEPGDFRRRRPAGSATAARMPAVLRARVTSKGGTTERALSCMDGDELKRKFVEAVKQAAERSRELGEQLGQRPNPQHVRPGAAISAGDLPGAVRPGSAVALSSCSGCVRRYATRSRNS